MSEKNHDVVICYIGETMMIRIILPSKDYQQADAEANGDYAAYFENHSVNRTRTFLNNLLCKKIL